MQERRWWQGGVIYQIYPRSFQDRNDDGVGDLQGVIDRLDYLSWLGVDALWFSPIFPSPMIDFGYDVADYTDIDPLFGTLDDFDRLVNAAHARDLRVILDLVPNHTSDRHPWFLESSASRQNPKRDWYIWRDADGNGGPPNNWLSEFGGSAWKWDEQTEQYYLHSFAREQPDLNWRNREVVTAMLDVMRFWLDRDVDGFRVDVIHQLLKDEQLRDDPLNPNYVQGKGNPHDSLSHIHSGYQPEVHTIIREFRSLMDGYDNRVLIGEIHYYASYEDIRAFYGDDDETHLPFNFWLILSPWSARAIRQSIDSYEDTLPPHAWPNYVIGNHDCSRIATRLGSEQARIAAMLLLTLRGTPFIYYGDELGMCDLPIPTDNSQDIRGINVPGHSRDPQRTPMQWNGQPNGGFSEAKPWLPLADDYREINVAVQQQDLSGMLNLYRSIIAYRRRSLALHAGSYRAVAANAQDCFVYLREYGTIKIMIALNFTDEPQILNLSTFNHGRVILSTHLDRAEAIDVSSFQLRANEGCIIEL